MFGGKSQLKCPTGSSTSLTLNLLIASASLPQQIPTQPRNMYTHTPRSPNLTAPHHCLLVFNQETDKLFVPLPSYNFGSLIDHKVLNISQISPLLSITRITTQLGTVILCLDYGNKLLSVLPAARMTFLKYTSNCSFCT